MGVKRFIHPPISVLKQNHTKIKINLQQKTKILQKPQNIRILPQNKQLVLEVEIISCFTLPIIFPMRKRHSLKILRPSRSFQSPQTQFHPYLYIYHRYLDMDSQS